MFQNFYCWLLVDFDFLLSNKQGYDVNKIFGLLPDLKFVSVVWKTFKLLTDACIIWWWTIVCWSIFGFQMNFHLCHGYSSYNLTCSAYNQIIMSDLKWNCLHSDTCTLIRALDQGLSVSYFKKLKLLEIGNLNSQAIFLILL